VPVEEKPFRIIQVADAATQPAETLGLLSKSQLQDHLIDQYWKTVSVDRKVREALRALSGAEPDPSVIRLVHGRVSALSQSDVPASIGRVRATFDFPVVAVPAMRPPSACPLRRDVVDPTHASIDKAVRDGTPWRRVTLRSALRDWETIYAVRPHQALGYRAPAEYLVSVGVEVLRTYRTSTRLDPLRSGDQTEPSELARTRRCEMEIVRTCTQCGTQDTSHVWPSLDKAAAAAGGIEFTWACPSCAGPEFELAERSLDDPVAAGAGSGSQPSAPTDPGEARRTLGPPGH